MKSTKTRGSTSSALRQFGLLTGILTAILVALFFRGLAPERTIFSNDGPLGVISAAGAHVLPGYTGIWQDLNWLGLAGPSILPSVPSTIYLIGGPLFFSKILAPFSLLFVGLCAWFCMRQFKLAPAACILVGMAAALNIDFLATAGWGVATQVICFGFCFLAIGAVADDTSPRRWVRLILAGFATGMAVMEGYDIGALFSLFISAFIIYQALTSEGSILKNASLGIARVAVVAGCAGLIATAALTTLIGTQIKGVAGMAQDKATKAGRWDEATTWSMPKRETLGIFVAGVFGYRMDTPEKLPEWMQEPYTGGQYWGASGRYPEWDRYFKSGKQGPLPMGFLRYGGGGNYLGITVALIAFWALFQSFQKNDGAFTQMQRRLIWFWAGAALVALLLSWGRFAPFFQFFYALPYASTIRNPGTKFMHVFQWAMLFLFAFGVHGLSRRFVTGKNPSERNWLAQWKTSWRKPGPERKWLTVMACLVVISVLGWFAYASQKTKLQQYLIEMQTLETLQRGGQPNYAAMEAFANATSSFSIGQVGWFVFVLTLAVVVFTLALNGFFSGDRARWGGIVIGALMVFDLGRVALPWIITYNYKERYIEAADNPVIQYLRQKPYENRVAIWPFGLPSQYAAIQDIYRQEWLHHLFQYYDIQSLDVIMLPRPPMDRMAFEAALYGSAQPDEIHPMVRRWELTNTRYIIGAAGLVEVINNQLDPKLKRFRLLMAFECYQTERGGPILTRTNTTGPFGLIEFTGALPRAKMYGQWQVCESEPGWQDYADELRKRLPPEYASSIAQLSVTDLATLDTLADAGFDPHQQVLLANRVPVSPEATNEVAGSVEFVSYTPKHVTLSAQNKTPAVLLLNDRYDPNWKLLLDGKPAEMLRCNFLMRGAFLEPGEHKVEFKYEPPVHGLYVTLAAQAIAVALIGYLIAAARRSRQTSMTPETAR